VKKTDPVLGDIVEFRTTSTGADVTLALYDEGEAFLSNLSITSGAQGTGVATTSTLINDLAEVTSPLVVGDTISISGTNPDGSTVSATYTYADEDTVQELLDAINVAFTGATATLNDDGKIVLTDNIPGESTSSITLNMAQTQGTFILPTFSNTVAGQDYSSHSTSIDVYDSLGNSHTVEMVFTKAAEENEWNWTINVDGGLITPSSGDSGTIGFNSDGSLAFFTGGPLVFTPTGAGTMSITLNPGTPGTFNGITQFNSPSTTIALDQDGYPMGELQGISIEVNGVISGTFSNGAIKTLGQIAIADFNNSTGLSKVGNNLFSESANSGSAVLGWAQTNFNTAVNSGYLEMSNVDLSKEFTELIVAQRGFQANARVIQTADMILAEINGLKR
jgi:flagellar hook protein FlgE